MNIGIDLGATKIESVLLENNGKELYKKRIESPKNYEKTITDITEIVINIEKKYKKKINVGVCHPGSTNLDTGLIQNAFNSPWLNNRAFTADISKSLNRKILCENDANCFALSEAFDGSAKNFNTVFGIILGSGCGGGLIIKKKILDGPNSFTGEWGHIPIGKPNIKNNFSRLLPMSRTKKADVEIDLHPCPGKTVNGVKRYIESNLRRDPNIPLCILHVGTNNASTLRDNTPIRQCAEEIFDVMELLNSIYPQAEIWFSGILPRLDDDHKRGLNINEVKLSGIYRLESRR